RAAQSEADLHAEATEIARQKTARRIAAALDRTSEERLARVNGGAPFRKLAATALSAVRSGEVKFAYSTTPHYLQIATNFGDGNSPIELPVVDAKEAAGADAQIWLHESLMDDRIQASIDSLGRPISVGDTLRAVSAAARIIGRNQDGGGPLGPLLAGQPILIHTAGGLGVLCST